MTKQTISHSIGRGRTHCGFAIRPAATTLPSACSHVHVRAAASTAAPMIVTDAQFATDSTNPWLGGDMSGNGLGSEDAIKRTTPGHLEAVT